MKHLFVGVACITVAMLFLILGAVLDQPTPMPCPKPIIHNQMIDGCVHQQSFGQTIVTCG
jgi:hypothetical protein